VTKDESGSVALSERLLDLISAVGKPDVDLEEALALTRQGLDDVFGGCLVRVHRPKPASDDWYEPGSPGSTRALERLESKLEVLSEVRLIRVEEIENSEAAEALRAQGFEGVLNLPAIAGGRLAAAIQLFIPTPPSDQGSATKLIDILASQLGHVAVRQRMRAALKTAAEYTREMSAARGEPSTNDRFYDARTGLPQTVILADRLRQAIRRRQRSGRSAFAVLLVQADGLRSVRAAGGREAAEEVLHSTARRLRALLRPADTVSRDGERFAIVLEGIRVPEDAMVVAGRVREVIRRPFPVGSSEFRVDPAVGVVFGGPSYDSPETLLRDAGEAAGRASDSQPRVQLFNLSSVGDRDQKRQLESELAGAIRRKDLFLEYQPIVALPSGWIGGLEVFIRWRHPEMGLVPPDVFIPVAASSPQVFELGYWVINETCEQIRQWRERLAPETPPPVAINIAGRQLVHPEFPDRVHELLERSAVQGQQLRFDVSETDLRGDVSRVSGILDRIVDLGIQVAIDDFSAAFSSLSLLHNLPVHAAKIDGSLLCRSEPQYRKWSVARTIVELATALEIEVIADGIESREQILHLHRAGCSQAQGHLFSGPVLPVHVEDLIKRGYPLDLRTSPGLTAPGSRFSFRRFSRATA
jgi:diguanylate cyclase (GGDEF)-like protein